MSREWNRIIDANLNRVREGVRVVEEIVRLVLEDRSLQQRLKTLRYTLAKTETEHFGVELIQSRDVNSDPGVRSHLAGEHRRTGWVELARINCRRVQEGLRVLEEVSKWQAPASSETFKRLRFSMYDIEQTLVVRLAPKKTSPRATRRKERTV